MKWNTFLKKLIKFNYDSILINQTIIIFSNKIIQNKQKENKKSNNINKNYNSKSSLIFQKIVQFETEELITTGVYTFLIVKALNLI